MMLLQITDIANDPGALAMISGTIGSVVTMGAQKFLNRKVDTQDIVSKQINMMSDLNTKLNTVVGELQEIACYRKNCNERINGEIKTK